MSQTQSPSEPQDRFVIEIDEERLAELPKRALPLATSVNDKFNIRIRKEDVVVLDAIAEAESTSRADVLNRIVQQTLLAQLQKLEGIDTRLAVALGADSLAGYEALEAPWAHDVLSGFIGQLIDDIQEHGGARVSEIQPDEDLNKYLATLEDPEERDRAKGHSETYFHYSQRIKEALK